MRLMDKQRKVVDTRRPNYAVFRRRRRIALLVLTLLAALIVAILGLYLLSGTTEETVDEPAEQVETPPAEEEPQEAATEEEPVDEEPAEEEPRGPVVPEDPTLYLTVPSWGYTATRSETTIRRSRSTWAPSSCPTRISRGNRRTPTPTSPVTGSAGPATRATTSASTFP